MIYDPKERICIGIKTVYLINGVGKTEQIHVSLSHTSLSLPLCKIDILKKPINSGENLKREKSYIITWKVNITKRYNNH